MSQETMTILIDGLFPLIGTLLTVIIFPQVKEFIEHYNLTKYAEMLVGTAEQLYKQDLIQDRYAYVVDKMLKRFDITEEQMEILVESLVNELNIKKGD